MSDPLESWHEEKRSAWLYRVVAECEQGTPRAALFGELAQAADDQAEIWLRVLAADGAPPPAPFRPDLRTRVVASLTRLFTPRAMHGVLAAMKVRGMSLYTQHAPHATPSKRDDIGKRHRTGAAGNALRAGVFGVNDGLVSNAALIYGVAGAAQASEVILLTGVAGLLAGAFSMAAGEYVSMRSQREMFEYQIGLERDELEKYPAEEAAELALIYAAKGMPEGEAKRVADTLMENPERALDTLAREELGLNPDELGSPWTAALASFAAFSVGAAVPLLPFLLGAGNSLALSVAFTALGLFAVGASMSLFTGRRAPLSGLRMLAIGGGAGLATYFIGAWLGVTLG
ncbi:conserved membrane protein [Thiobacillus denitrificans ATCC 25259]|uniref:Conserved membrane protein n=1 Tax=Thiobacillus denitrificans (strain ATCC 25259 / T1) TaxID=292415 RepID=Q3SM61_THIDA|nr:VIT1/CCC1 transporter family protein [Thiobacillus denitrificans]AAZ96189.1 conserved membrane protein [Thiobacillus denitrificans ATCC 25259]